MIDSQSKGLPFPKGAYNKKINGRTNFTLVTETKLLPVAANWDTSLFGLQLEYLPALPADAVGQTIANPVVTCVDDSTTRTVVLKRPDSTDPVVGEVFLDIFSGTIQFNPADANKTFSVAYYKKASLVDHNAMNRIWSGGPTYIVGDQPYHDFSDLQTCLTGCLGGERIKLQKDIVTTGLTCSVSIYLDGNNKKITKSGTALNSRALNFSGDLICRDVDFQLWSAVGDVCLYASADVKAIISTNKAIGCTKLTNAATACTYSIVENNLPFSENVGQATTLITNNVGDKLIKQYTATNAISVNDPVFKDLVTGGNCKKSTAPTDADIFLGFALNNAAIGNTVNVCTNGTMTGLSGLTANRTYFITSTGTLATIALGSKPLSNAYPAYSSNPLAGSTGASYHTYVGKAISTSEIVMTPKRMNNMTPLNVGSGVLVSGVYDGLNLLGSNGVSPGFGFGFNLFIDAATGSTRQPFDTSGVPWAIKLDMSVRLNALYATSSLPEFKVELLQYDSGTTNLRTVDTFTYAPMSTSVTNQMTVPLEIILRNLNPGAGQCQVKVSASAGSGSVSGGYNWYFLKSEIIFE